MTDDLTSQQRVRAFLAQRDQMRGIDQEVILGANYTSLLRSDVEALLAAREDAGQRVAAALALHTGTHLCVGGAWWTDDPTYHGSIARVGLCPTRAALSPAGDAPTCVNHLDRPATPTADDSDKLCAECLADQAGDAPAPGGEGAETAHARVVIHRGPIPGTDIGHHWFAVGEMKFGIEGNPNGLNKGWSYEVVDDQGRSVDDSMFRLEEIREWATAHPALPAPAAREDSGTPEVDR